MCLLSRRIETVWNKSRDKKVTADCATKHLPEACCRSMETACDLSPKHAHNTGYTLPDQGTKTARLKLIFSLAEIQSVLYLKSFTKTKLSVIALILRIFNLNSTVKR